MSQDPEILQRMLARERAARKAAEQTLEEKSMELFFINQELRKVNQTLESTVEERTRELQKSEERFRSIVENAEDIIFRTGGDGRIIYANPKALHKFGYTQEELLNMHYQDFIDPAMREDIHAQMINVIKSGSPNMYLEVTVHTKSGELLWIGQNLQFEYDSEGRMVRTTSVLRDITESKILNDRIFQLSSSMRSGLLLLDTEGRIVTGNQALCDMLRLEESPEDLQGRRLKSLIRKENKDFVQPRSLNALAEELMNGEDGHATRELETTAGLILELDYVPLFIDGIPNGHLLNFREVTEERELLRKVSASEEKYRGIISNMNLGLLEIDLEGKVAFANQSFCQMSGYNIEDLIGKDPSSFLLDDEARRLMAEKDASRKEGKGDAYEIQVTGKDGNRMWWLISGAPRYSPSGEYIGSIGIHLDISLQKELEIKLMNARDLAEESSRAKEAFLANMSHEIRTPMNGVLAMARQLSKTRLDNEQSLYLKNITSAAEHLLVILNDILDMSKVQAGKLNIEKIPFRLIEPLRRVERVLGLQAEEKGLTLQIEHDPNIPEIVLGDPHRMAQVMINLVGNAIKFTEKGGVSIKTKLISTQKEHAEVQIEVNDTGIGIAPEYMDRLFDDFSQEDSSTARKFGGTGLGMRISKQLIELMQGKLMIDSEKGQGTQIRLHFAFPISDELPEGDEQKTLSAEEVMRLRNKKILVAEDNELNQFVVETFLKAYQCQLFFAGNGEEAVHLASENSIDLILMDLQMPIMDGLEAFKRIGEDLKLSIPTIALTANAITGQEEECLQAGMNDYLAKPFEEDTLLSKMVALLEPKDPIESGEPLFSLRKIEAMGGVDDAIKKRMIDIFKDQIPKAIAELKDSWDANDMLKLASTAHRIKPSLDYMLIDSIHDEIRFLEKVHLSSPNQDEVKFQLDLVIQVLETVLDQLED
jgi:PAS domain S-box-containing protein